MNKTVQKLIDTFANLPITPETTAKRHKIVKDLAWHNVHMQSGRWMHFTDGADLGLVSPVGSVREKSKVTEETNE